MPIALAAIMVMLPMIVGLPLVAGLCWLRATLRKHRGKTATTTINTDRRHSAGDLLVHRTEPGEQGRVLRDPIDGLLEALRVLGDKKLGDLTGDVGLGPLGEISDRRGASPR